MDYISYFFSFFFTFFFFNDTTTTEIYTLSLHDALPISADGAMDAFAGLTSQPPLGSIVAALAHLDRATGLEIGRAHV